MSDRRRFLVTAGNTREPIDRVRDWGNIFTGNTGYGIAKALAAAGEVDLLTSNRAHLAELSSDQRVRASGFTSHAELKGALAALMAREKYDAVFMTAAVADYKPAGVYEILSRAAPGDLSGREQWVVRRVQAEKVKSAFNEIAVVGTRTAKLVDLFRTKWKHAGLLVKFKLEVGMGRKELIKVGQASRAASGADYLVANTLEMVDGPEAGAYLLSDRGAEWVPRSALPSRLVALVTHHGG